MLRSRIQNEWNKNPVAAAATVEQALELYPNDSEVILAAANLAAVTGNTVQGKTAGEISRSEDRRYPRRLLQGGRACGGGHSPERCGRGVRVHIG